MSHQLLYLKSTCYDNHFVNNIFYLFGDCVSVEHLSQTLKPFVKSELGDSLTAVF